MKQSKTSLTIHLYRKDEALAALRSAIISNDLSETIFWGIELYDSNMQNDALEMLQNVWLTYIGFGSWWFLDSILNIYESGELDRNSWISMLHSSNNISIHDSSIFILLIRGALTPIDWKPMFPHSKEYTDLNHILLDCLRRGKIKEAWLVARAIEPAEQWKLLTVFAEEKGRITELLKLQSFSSFTFIEKIAISYILVSVDDINWIASKKSMYSELPEYLVIAMNALDSEKSIRKSRVFQPSNDALLYITERSSQPADISSETDIQDKLIETLLQSSYWQDILSNYMDIETRSWVSDIKLEEFYETYFSMSHSDIPDEWSKDSRQKSHSYGLGLSIEESRKQYIYHILQCSKRFEEWDSLEYTFKENIDCTLDWKSIYNEIQPYVFKSLRMLLPLKPVRKQFVIE